MPFSSRAHLIHRETSLQDSEYSHHHHKWLVKRPIIKEYHSSRNASSLHLQSLRHEDSPALAGMPCADSHNPKDEDFDNPLLAKRRFELFIDLIWVGIIGNLADSFSEEAFSDESDTPVGRAVGNFILLFVTAWRLWKFLQLFMSRYHTNDLVERFFVVWILILALLYGNNAPYLLISGPNQSDLAIIVYIIARVSFMFIETVYSYYIPWLRRGMVVRAIFSLPLTALWVGMVFVPKGKQIFMLIAVNVLEFLLEWAASAPFLAHFLREERAKAIDPDHWIERIREFFTIILGEGVLNLIRGSPLGCGLNQTSGNGISVLIVYYALIGFYYIGDQSRRYIHPVKRAWWRKELWQMLHVVLFHTLLILGVGMTFLLQHGSVSAVVKMKGEEEAGTREEPSEEDKVLASHMYTAKWVVSTALATTLAMQTLIAILSKSLDGQQVMKVNNRYLRLLPRGLAIVVIVCLPIEKKMEASLYILIVMLVTLVVLVWEFTAGLDYGGGFLER